VFESGKAIRARLPSSRTRTCPRFQPGKIVGWILGTQEAGARIKR